MGASVGGWGTPHLLELLAGKCLEPSSPLSWVLHWLLSLILEQPTSLFHRFSCCLASVWGDEGRLHRPLCPLPPAKPHLHSPHSRSPWPSTGPGTPVGLRVGLEALESSLAGAGVGIVPDGEVGLQPREMGVGAERHLPDGWAHTT